MTPLWYFAYGSNMDPEQMRERGVTPAEALPCRLNDWRFSFRKLSKDGTGKANLVAAPGSAAIGVAYRVRPEALDLLQAHEKGYDLRSVEVHTADGRTLPAQAFVAAPQPKPLVPAPEYLARILRGAAHHKLPRDYLKEIEAAAAPAPAKA